MRAAEIVSSAAFFNGKKVSILPFSRNSKGFQIVITRDKSVYISMYVYYYTCIQVCTIKVKEV